MKYRAREIITVNTFGHNFSVLFFSQFLAALLAIVYMDLNFNQTPEITVLDMYNEYVWKDNTDLVKKDVLCSQSALGFVTSYMIGQMEISRVSTGALFACDINMYVFFEIPKGELPLSKQLVTELLQSEISLQFSPSNTTSSIAGRELERDFTLEEFPYELLRR